MFDNSQLQINIPSCLVSNKQMGLMSAPSKWGWCQQQANGVDVSNKQMGLIAEFTQLRIHFKFQVELACQTLKLIKIGWECTFFSIYSQMTLKRFPKKQRNTATLFSPEKISTVEIFCICKMWWVWYHIKNPDLSMTECENIHRDVFNNFKRSMEWLFRL